MSRPIPIVLCVDVEPDGRQLNPSSAARFAGFERLVADRAAWRARLPSAIGISWFVRIDDQIAGVYGSPSWPLVHYRRELDELQAVGDEIGIHTHVFRQHSDGRSWIVDHGDQAGIDRTVRGAFEAFASARGSACRIFRFGDHWMNDATARLLDALGVSIDLTLEPGMPGRPSLIASEPHTGAIPDLSATPRVPFRPSAGDFRIPDAGRDHGLWMMPVTTGCLPAHLRRGRAVYRWLTRAADAEFDVLALNPGLSPLLFRALVSSVVVPQPPPCLVIPLRSNIGSSTKHMARLRTNLKYLAAHPLSDRFVWSTASQALALVRAAEEDAAVSSHPSEGGIRE